MAKITIYKDINFGGQSWEYNDSKSNLKDDGFGDKVSSCKVEDGRWILYKDSNYGGNDCRILDPGEYADFHAMGLSDNSLDSLRLLPISGICLFEHDNYRGQMVALTDAVSDLKEINFDNKTSSVIVVSSTWNLYEDKDFKGDKWPLHVGLYATPKLGDFNNDSISSVKLQ